VGNSTHCQISYVHGNAREPRYRWRLDGERANGILGDLGSHLIDLARWLNGNIVRVADHLANHVQRFHDDGRPVVPANDAALLTAEFANGSQGTIHTSAVSYTGERGMEQHTEVFNCMPAGDRYFIDCILEDRPISPSLWDGVAVQEIMDAAIASHKTGKWIDVRPL
jgi:predicted dehydrogenase